jgi:hypothetical protein
MDFAPLTKEEKEKLVIQLYEKGKNIRDISREVHMNFGDIGEITRRYSGDEKERPKKLSKHSQGLELFHRGYTNLAVAAKLDLTASETIDEQKQYRTLIHADKFSKVYDALKTELPSFVSLYEKIKEEGLTIKEVLEAAKYANKLLLIKSEYATIWNEVQTLKGEKNMFDFPVRPRKTITRRSIPTDEKYDVFQD